MERFKIETGRMKGAPKYMRIFEFMHGINNPELTKRLNEHVPKTMEEMMIATTAFIRGEAAAANKKKGHMPWKPHDQSKKHTDKRHAFRGHSRDGRGANRFTPLTRTPKEILAAEVNNFQPLPPMVMPVEKRNDNKFCDFHNDKGHSTDECMQLKKQIEELVRAGKLSHLIKEIKQGREQPKMGRKEAAAKDKPMTIYMVRSWQRTVKEKITQSFEQGKEITFPPLVNSNGTEGPLVIEAEVGGHTIHRMYIDGGSSMEILYEHCFNRLRPDIKRQMVPATTSLTGFSGETTWPLRQLKLLVTIGDPTHSTKAWMNFMLVKSLSPYNGIIGRSGLKAIQAVPSTVHGMLKFLTKEGIVIIRSSLLIPSECASVDTSSVTPGEKKAHPANLTKKKGQSPERTKAIQTEVEKLVEAGIMSEVYYHDWLSNPVMVKNTMGAGGYEEKTTFYTGQGVYCYTKMPFGLKNADATYQRLMDKAFENQMGRNIEVYVDDLVIKSHTETKMVRDIAETFQTLRKIHMKLNPKKCLFGLAEGVFLGPADRTGDITDVSLLHKPCVIGSETKLLTNGKAGIITGLCSKKASKIFSGTSYRDGSGAGLILTNPNGVEFTYALRFQFAASNNEAKYEALIVGLRIATQMGVKNIQANVDSKLVANQVLGTYVAKEDNMIKYLEIAKGLVSGFKTFSISQVPRSKNKKADALSKITSTSFAHLSKQVLVEVLETKSIIGKEVTAVIEEEGPTWMMELVNYLKEDTLPEDEKEARKIRLKAL
nr:reverse transcriptase domain-containing protein [Tanacetum cinerariifolium]